MRLKLFTSLVNASVLILLLLLLIGYFAIPDKVLLMTNRQEAIEKAVDKIREEVVRLHAAQDNVEIAVDQLTTPLESEIETFERNYANLLGRLDKLEKDIALLSQHSLVENGHGNGTGSAQIPAVNETTIPAIPDEDIQRKADSIADGIQLTNFSFNDFFEQAMLNGLIPTQLSEESKDIIKQYFDLFQAKAKMFGIDRRLLIEKSVEEMNNKKAYIEIPLAATIEEVRSKIRSQSQRKPVLSHLRKYESLGVQRYYGFSHDEYPQFREYQIKMEHARRQMLKSMYDYGQSLNTKE